MEKRPLTLYTSNLADAKVRNLATELSQEHLVQLRDTSQLPAPDRWRVGRQNLLSRRADLVHELKSYREQIRLIGSHPKLVDKLASLRLLEEGLVGAIDAIDTLLLEQEGGQADG